MKRYVRGLAVLSLALSLGCGIVCLGLSGCGHEHDSPYETVIDNQGNSGDPSDPADEPIPDVLPAIGQVKNVTGGRGVQVGFDHPMKTDTVELDFFNSSNTHFRIQRMMWNEERTILTAYAPLPYCGRISVNVRGGATAEDGGIIPKDQVFELVQPANPADFDRTLSCTAEVPIAPVFTGGQNELDSLILRGDQLQRQMNYRNGTAITDTWFHKESSTSYDAIEQIITYPGEGYNSATALIALLKPKSSESAAIAVYRGYSVQRPEPNMGYWVPLWRDAQRHLAVPLKILPLGDMTGDTKADLGFVEVLTTDGQDRLMRVSIMTGPLFKWYDTNWNPAIVKVIGAVGDVMRDAAALGDVTGDGLTDLAVIGASLGADDTLVESHLEIYRGIKSSNAILDFKQALWIEAPAGRLIDQVEAADVNGDGIADLVVSSLEGSNFESVQNPQISIIFGGEGFADVQSLEDADVQLAMATSPQTTLQLARLGDLNADGLQDFGVLIQVEDPVATAFSSRALVIFLGREVWPATLNLRNDRDIMVRDPGYATFDLKTPIFDPKIGDVNNDGYDDFMVRASDGGSPATQRIYLFQGGTLGRGTVLSTIGAANQIRLSPQ